MNTERFSLASQEAFKNQVVILTKREARSEGICCILRQLRIKAGPSIPLRFSRDGDLLLLARSRFAHSATFFRMPRIRCATSSTIPCFARYAVLCRTTFVTCHERVIETGRHAGHVQLQRPWMIVMMTRPFR